MTRQVGIAVALVCAAGLAVPAAAQTEMRIGFVTINDGQNALQKVYHRMWYQPEYITKLRQADDEKSAAILEVIYQEEIGHVAAGQRWFAWLCGREGLDPKETWQGLVRRNFRGLLKPPFNAPARAEAGLTEDFYAPLAALAD